jgi:hypothetical protein
MQSSGYCQISGHFYLKSNTRSFGLEIPTDFYDLVWVAISFSNLRHTPSLYKINYCTAAQITLESLKHIMKRFI